MKILWVWDFEREIFLLFQKLFQFPKDILLACHRSKISYLSYLKILKTIPQQKAKHSFLSFCEQDNLPNKQRIHIPIFLFFILFFYFIFFILFILLYLFFYFYFLFIFLTFIFYFYNCTKKSLFSIFIFFFS